MEKHFSVNQSAELAGMSTKTVRRKIDAREIEHVRVGRRIVIPASALADFMSKNTVKSANAEAKANQILGGA